MITQNSLLYRLNRKYGTPLTASAKYARALAHLYDRLTANRVIYTTDQLCVVTDTKANTLVDLSLLDNEPTENGTLTFTADQGFDGWTSSNYIDVGFSPDSATYFTASQNFCFAYQRDVLGGAGFNIYAGGVAEVSSPHGIYVTGTGFYFMYPTTADLEVFNDSNAGFVGHGRYIGDNATLRYVIDASYGTRSISSPGTATTNNFGVGGSDDPPDATHEIACWGVGYLSRSSSAGVDMLFSIRNAIQQYMSDLGTAV